MEAILRVSRSRQHALTTALRVDMAYLCVDVRTVFSLLLAPLFSVIFQGEAYGDGFGYRMGVIMTVFICAVRSDRLDAVASVVSGLVVESASIDDIIRLTNAHDSNRDLSGR